MMFTNNPVLDAERYQAEQERRLEELPVCEYCNRRIDEEDLFDIEGTLYHEECAEKLFRRKVEFYVG